MRISRRSLVTSLACAAAAPAAAFSQTLRTIKAAGVPEDSATPVLWAQQSGIFRRYGIDLQLEKQRSGAAIVAGVLGGAYQIGKSSLAALIVAHTKGLPLVCIAPCGLYDAANPVIALLVKADSPFRTGADLNNKTVAVSSLNDVYTLATKAWVDQNGGNSSTLKLVELPVTAVAEAVAIGRVDAAGCAMPELQEALDGGKVRVLAHDDRLCQSESSDRPRFGAGRARGCDLCQRTPPANGRRGGEIYRFGSGCDRQDDPLHLRDLAGSP
jgi:NitT/TauT family transport system substrate-binding protein